MLFLAISVGIVLAVGLLICANYGRRLLMFTDDQAPKRKFRLPLWAKLLIVASPFYVGAMYAAQVVYNPSIQKREYLRRPFKPLLDSKFSAVAHSYSFANVADLPDHNRSDVLLYEDGKLLGPGHSEIYHVAVFGMGRYRHFKHEHAAIAFSSSDNTDPMTNGRVYWAERSPGLR